MNLLTVNGAKIEAVSACVPKNVVNNRDYAKRFFKDDMSPLIDTLGIEFRHVCGRKETTALDMCVAAAENIFASGHVSRNDIGAVIFVTQTPDFLVPNNASSALYKLGIPCEAMSFDINHACAGFVYGLYVSSLIAVNSYKKVLLLVGDTNTRYASPRDKGTSLLFGDAGTATIITHSLSAKESHFIFNTDGANADKVCLDMGYRTQLTADSLKYKEVEGGNVRRQIDMFMDGVFVFDYALKTVSSMITYLMDELEYDSEDFSRVLAHQSNEFLLKKIAKKTGFSKEKVEIIINEFGNCSSSCIPLILSHHEGKPSEHLLLYAMGGGLSAGVADIWKDNLINLGITEKDF